MRFQSSVFASLCCVALLGMFSTLDLSASSAPGEIADVVSDELVGGASCNYFSGVFCNRVAKTGCPTQAGFRVTTNTNAPFYGQGENYQTCGCVKKPGTGCSTDKFYEKVTVCGSSTT